ncbi:DNA-binding transcriptional regulator YhcF (GntR family) [Nocardiopsis sp. Huas11]|uniref:GntR family transcriptional regulator n=1 Tax=Nocardiopsis sp. Huas11 TaxID=2183912 RepID=UPI000EB178F1|nr:GntR family transcriptional regulator [Nocardiopsis sp. Huas11]RKS05696.1 DNA-binding transcriptional regulator YhcF (GntR family) [Nocardiopsis sp. Huas11]
MIIEVEPRGPLPPYEQIRRQILALVVSGELAPGARLPTIRQLSGDLNVAPNTVARAFRELEAVGVLSSRRRHGTSVTDDAREHARAALSGAAPPPAAGTAPPTRPPDLEEAARAFTAHAHGLGHGLDEALEAVRRSW